MQTVARGDACTAGDSLKRPPIIWHMRLFTVIKPVDPPRGPESSSWRYLWGSEDLAILCLTATTGLNIVKQSLEYSELMDYPMLDRYYSNQNMLTPIIEVLAIRHRPALFLMLAVKEMPARFDPVSYDFPIIVCDISPFKSYPDEYLCISGDNMFVQQVLLLRNDTRQVRDDKLELLATHCGRLVNPFQRPPEFSVRHDPRQASAGLDRVYWPKNRVTGRSLVGQNYIIFYLTEMWPGGTSAVIPAADVAQIRTLFPGAPILGGRGKCFMANQNISLNTQSTQHSSALQMRPTTTVVTVLCFG